MELKIIELLKGTSLVFGFRLIGAFVVFVTQIFLARLIGAEELGIYVLGFSWCLLLSTIAAIGFPAASLRFIGDSLAEGKMGNLKGFVQFSRKIVFAFGSIMSFVAIICIFAFRDIIPENYTLTLVFAAICIPPLAMHRLNDKIAHALSLFVLAFLPQWSIRPILFLLLIVIVYYSNGMLTSERVMFLQLSAIVIVAVCHFMLLKKKLNKYMNSINAQFEYSLWLKTSIPLLASTLIVQSIPDLSVVILGLLLPSSDVAIFYSSFRVALFIAFGLTAVNALITPRASGYHAIGDREGLQRLVIRATQFKFLASLVALLFLILFGKDVLLLFGNEFVVGHHALIILALAQLVLAASGPVDLLLNLTGYQNRCLIAFTTSMVVAIILNFILVPSMGITGAAIAVFITTLFWNIWLYLVVVDRLKIYPSIISIFNSNRMLNS